MLAKIEGRNPAYSVKCRIGPAMVAQAERDELVMGRRELMEPTSGNTGIALAFVTIKVVLPNSGERYSAPLSLKTSLTRRACRW